MKKLMTITALAVCFAFTSAIAQNTKSEPAPKQDQPTATDVKVNPNGPVARYDKTVYEFPDLTQGNPGTATFNLFNEGKEPLIIASANASCGCTNLQYGKDPILPGKSTAISATYNAAVAGPFTKTITVKTNASEQPVVLQIKGKVLPKPADAAQPAPAPQK
jgi:hypothetical protein